MGNFEFDPDLMHDPDIRAQAAHAYEAHRQRRGWRARWSDLHSSDQALWVITVMLRQEAGDRRH